MVKGLLERAEQGREVAEREGGVARKEVVSARAELVEARRRVGEEGARFGELTVQVREFDRGSGLLFGACCGRGALNFFACIGWFLTGGGPSVKIGRVFHGSDPFSRVGSGQGDLS